MPNTKMSLSPRARCPHCGRFMKRGLWEFMLHSQICRGRTLIYRYSSDSGFTEFQHGFKTNVHRIISASDIYPQLQ